MTNPYFNSRPFARGTLVRSESVNAEFAKVEAAFAKLPDPTAIPNGGGAPNYTHYAYSDSADGTANFTTGAAGTRAYVGVAVNQVSATPSEVPEDYAWTRLRGQDGTDGAPGDDGDPGAAGTNGTNGQYTEYRFVRSLAPPPAAVGNAPANTFLSIPNGVDPVWVTEATRNGDDVLITGWAEWVRISPYTEPTTYDANDTYYEGMQVTFGGGTYILLVDQSTGTAPTGTGQANGTWGVIAAPGDAGSPATAPSAFTATIDLTSSNTGINLRTAADAAGYTGQSDATITFNVPSGVTINGTPGSGSGGGHGIDTGSWPTNDYTIDLTIVVQSGGIVNGGGGRGGAGGSGIFGSGGGAGGDAIYQRLNLTQITIDSGGTLRGGGGGGAGGSGNFFFDGLEIGEQEPVSSAGGGGGGGAPNGPGGGGGMTFLGGNATNGSAGSTSGGGNGGAPLNQPGVTASAGGNGGTFGATGQTSAGVPGGAAGNAVRRNGYTSPYTNNGTAVGTVG